MLCGVPAGPTWADPVPGGVSTVDGQPIPVEGSFRYEPSFSDSPGQVRGLVHGVRRVDGGTVLYYSIGMVGGAGETFPGHHAFPDSSHPYELGMATDLTLLDPAGLTAYRPLFTGSRTFATARNDLAGPYGTMRVGWAAFPELPAGTKSVQVLMPFGTAVGRVPVGSGALMPAAGEPAPPLGQGWPAVPSGAELAGADTARSTFPVLRRTGDRQGAATVQEGAREVAVNLDANVLFATGSAALSARATVVLTRVAEDIAARGTGQVTVTGHTDSQGSDSANLTLSQQRAAAVMAVLRPAAGSSVTFRSSGRGEAEPVAPNTTAAGRRANRRVTVDYAVKEK